MSRPHGGLGWNAYAPPQGSSSLPRPATHPHDESAIDPRLRVSSLASRVAPAPPLVPSHCQHPTRKAAVKATQEIKTCLANLPGPIESGPLAERVDLLQTALEQAVQTIRKQQNAIEELLNRQSQTSGELQEASGAIKRLQGQVAVLEGRRVDAELNCPGTLARKAAAGQQNEMKADAMRARWKGTEDDAGQPSARETSAEDPGGSPAAGRVKNSDELRMGLNAMKGGNGEREARENRQTVVGPAGTALPIASAGNSLDGPPSQRQKPGASTGPALASAGGAGTGMRGEEGSAGWSGEDIVPPQTSQARAAPPPLPPTNTSTALPISPEQPTLNPGRTPSGRTLEATGPSGATFSIPAPKAHKGRGPDGGLSKRQRKNAERSLRKRVDAVEAVAARAPYITSEGYLVDRDVFGVLPLEYHQTDAFYRCTMCTMRVRNIREHLVLHPEYDLQRQYQLPLALKKYPERDPNALLSPDPTRGQPQPCIAVTGYGCTLCAWFCVELVEMLAHVETKHELVGGKRASGVHYAPCGPLQRSLTDGSTSPWSPLNEPVDGGAAPPVGRFQMAARTDEKARGAEARLGGRAGSMKVTQSLPVGEVVKVVARRREVGAVTNAAAAAAAESTSVGSRGHSQSPQALAPVPAVSRVGVSRAGVSAGSKRTWVAIGQEVPAEAELEEDDMELDELISDEEPQPAKRRKMGPVGSGVKVEVAVKEEPAATLSPEMDVMLRKGGATDAESEWEEEEEIEW